VIEATAQEASVPTVETAAIPAATAVESVPEVVPTEVQIEAQPTVADVVATEVVPPTATEIVPVEAVVETLPASVPTEAQTQAEIPPAANNSGPNLSSPVLVETPVAAIEETAVEPVPSVEATTVPAESVTDTAAEIAPTDNQVQVETPVFATETAPVDLVPTATMEIVVTEAIPTEIVPTQEAIETEAAVDPTPSPEAEPGTLAVVSGQVASFLGSSIEINLSLKLVADGSMIELVAEEAGTFLFENLGPGEYILEASATGYLSKQASFTLSEGQQLALPTALLYAGDLDNDNEINLSDMVLIAANYNGPALISEADLNSDAWIDISDLTIVGAQFGMIGPIPWDPQS
jgi:hypothetical protein